MYGEVSEATSALPRWDKFLSTCPQSLCLSPVSRHPIWPSFILNPSASLQDGRNHSTHGFRDAPSREVDWEKHCMGHAATLSPHSISTFPIPIRATHPLTPRSDPPFSLLGLQICAANQPALPIHSFRVEDGEAVPALSPSSLSLFLLLLQIMASACPGRSGKDLTLDDVYISDRARSALAKLGS